MCYPIGINTTTNDINFSGPSTVFFFSKAGLSYSGIIYIYSVHIRKLIAHLSTNYNFLNMPPMHDDNTQTLLHKLINMQEHQEAISWDETKTSYTIHLKE